MDVRGCGCSEVNSTIFISTAMLLNKRPQSRDIPNMDLPLHVPALDAIHSDNSLGIHVNMQVLQDDA